MLKIAFTVSVLLLFVLVLAVGSFYGWLGYERNKWYDKDPDSHPSVQFCWVSQAMGWPGFPTGHRWYCENLLADDLDTVDFDVSY